jgi:hypothetical protein
MRVVWFENEYWSKSLLIWNDETLLRLCAVETRDF